MKHGGVFQNFRSFLRQRRNLALLALLANTAVATVAGPLFPPEAGIIPPSNGFSESVSVDFGIATDDLRATWLENQNFAREDARQYALMAWGQESYAPYSLRPLVPFLISVTSHLVSDSDDPAGFLNNLYISVYFWNFLFVAGAGLFTFLAVTRISRDALLGVGFGAVAIANVGNIQTASFLMTDPASYFFASLILYLVVSNRPLLAGISLGVGVLAKEIVIIFTLLLLISFFRGQRWKSILAALVSGLSFVAVRLLNREDPLSVQYGWDVSRGDIRLDYLLLHADDPQRFLFRSLIALAGPLLVAILHIGRTPLGISVLMWSGTGLVVLSNLLLASGVTRVLQIALTFLCLAPWVADGSRTPARSWRHMFWNDKRTNDTESPPASKTLE